MQLERGSGRKHVKWDEQKLKETEKTRGTFEKIDEPKTPYRANSSSDEQMEVEGKTPEQQEVQQSLNRAKINRDANRPKKINLAELNAKLKEEMEKYHMSQNRMDEEEDAEEIAARKKHEEFKKKRAAHYNEHYMIQKMRNNQWENEDDD